MKKISWWIPLAILVLVLVILTPYLVQLLTNSMNPNLENDRSSWIGFYGNFTGAIIGGIIGGLVTLFGIQFTLKQEKEIHQQQLHQEREQHEQQIRQAEFLVKIQLEKQDKDRFIERFPSIMIGFDHLVVEINRLEKRIKEAKGTDFMGSFDRENVRPLLEAASKVDGDLYRTVNNFINDMLVALRFSPLENLGSDIAEIKESIIARLLTLRINIGNYNDSLMEKFSELTRVTSN